MNDNAMVGQRGILNLVYSDAQRDAICRRGNAMILNEPDGELPDVGEVRKLYPFLNFENAGSRSRVGCCIGVTAPCDMM